MGRAEQLSSVPAREAGTHELIMTLMLQKQRMLYKRIHSPSQTPHQGMQGVRAWPGRWTDRSDDVQRKRRTTQRRHVTVDVRVAQIVKRGQLLLGFVVLSQSQLNAQPRAAKMLSGVAMGLVSHLVAHATPGTDTTLLTSLPSITTDTGDFAPGHRDFARYEAPAQCYAAVMWTEIVHRRLWVLHTDSNRYRTLRDTVGGAAVAAVARACSARIPTAMAQQDPDLMFKLAMAQNDLLLARTWFAQVLRHPQGAEVEDLLQYSLDSVHPANIAAVRIFLAQLDSLGPAARMLQLRGQATFLVFWEHGKDTVPIHQTAEALLQRAHASAAMTWSKDERKLVDTAYRALLGLAWATQSDSVLPLARRFCQDDTSNFVGSVQCNDIRDPAKTSGLLSQLKQSELQWSHVQPLIADAWYLAPGADTLVPCPGSVSLLIELPTVPQPILTAPTRNGEDSVIDAIRFHVREWLAEYGGLGLRVTAFHTTSGRVVLKGLQTFPAEAQTMRWYIQDYLHLPVTVAVINAYASAWRPAPDGRAIFPTDRVLYERSGKWVNSRTGTYRRYTVIDQHGALVVNTEDPKQVEHGLQALLGSPRPSPRVSSSPTP